MAWAITFTAVCTLILCLGFGPVGIGAGMWSSRLQGYPRNAVYSQLTDVQEHSLLHFSRTCMEPLPQPGGSLRL